MNHRAKNILAVVQVLARQTAQRDPADYIERFEARLLALAASHDILVNNVWQDIPLEELIRSQLGHFKHLIGERILLSGPDIKVVSTAAQGLGLALHELSTNAAKYGALSTDVGCVVISWKKRVGESGEHTLEIVWAESGGPKVNLPKARGFGSFMIEKSLAMQFGCKVEIDFNPAGVTCFFKAKADKVISDVSFAGSPFEAASPLPRIDAVAGR